MISGATCEHRMLLGAHVSIAGGVRNAPENGVRIGCDVIQIFTKNQRQWAAKPYPPEEIEAFRDNYKASGLKGVVAHASYLLNLASADETLWKKSKEALLDEATRCDQLGVTDLVFHPGAHMGKGTEYGVKRIAQAMRDVLGKMPNGRVRLVPECMAGQGSTVGSQFEDLARILELVDEKERTGICLDTCHMFAAGHDLSTPEGYEATMNRVDRTVGLKRVTVFQLNDSKGPLACHVDRHEDIGKGHIGRAGFALLMNDARFARIPMALETPGTDDGYKENLRVLRSLIGKTVAPARATLGSFAAKSKR